MMYAGYTETDEKVQARWSLMQARAQAIIEQKQTEIKTQALETPEG